MRVSIGQEEYVGNPRSRVIDSWWLSLDLDVGEQNCGTL